MGVLLLLMASSACRKDSPTAPQQIPPLLFRSSTPADSAVNVFGPTPIDVVVNFRRQLEEFDRLEVQILPTPVSMGTFVRGGGTGAEIVWPSVLLDASIPAYNVLLDGPSMPEPKILTFHTGGMAGDATKIWGKIEIANASAKRSGVLVFALEIGGTVPEEGGLVFLNLPAVSVAVPHQDVGEFESKYVLVGLKADTDYVIFALADVNNNAYYELGGDWWGYSRSLEGSNVPVTAIAGTGGIDFSLLRPGSLPYDIGF